MPTYDYQCRSCGSVTEVIHSMLEEGPAVCERCGGPLRRMLYPTGIIFRGSGFYRNDSRNGGEASTPSSSETSTSSPPKPTQGSTDASSGSSKGGGEKTKGEETPKG